MMCITYIFFYTSLILLSYFASSLGALSNESSDVAVLVLGNETSALSPSEFVELNFTITRRNDTAIVNNVSINVRLPSQELSLVHGKLLGANVQNQSARFAYNETSLELFLNKMSAGQTEKLTMIAKAANSLSQNKIITLVYTLQYDLHYGNSSLQIRFLYSKTFLTYSKPPFLETSIGFSSNAVQGEDRINASMTVINRDKGSTAYNIEINLHTLSINISSVNCIANQSISNGTDSRQTNGIFINLTSLEANAVFVCFVSGIVKRNIKPGERLINNFVMQYYHKPKMPDLYPLLENSIKYINVIPIHGEVTPSVNVSRMMAGDVFNMTVTLKVPKSISPLLIRIAFPVIETNTRKRRSTSSKSVLKFIPFVQLAQTSNFTYQIGSAIKISESPGILLIDNKTVGVDFGVVSSNGDARMHTNATSISFTISLQVVNNPLHLSGRGAEIIVNFGNSNASLPIFVIGPILKPMLTITKSIQIVDTSKESPTIKFTVTIKHENISEVDAEKLTITDFTQNIVLYSRLVLPTGTVTVSSSYLKGGYIISAFVDQLKVSDTVTLVYQGAFSKGTQIKQAKWKASMTWKSPQANSPFFGPIHSQESCISTVSKVIKKTEKNYTMIALGVVLGLILGALTGLLVLFCIRKTRVAKTYAFLNLLQTQEDEESTEKTKLDKQEPSRLFSFKNPLLNRHSKQSQSVQHFTADGDCWAYMAVAKYKMEAIENARYRTLMEQLLKAHESSFLFIVDGISQIITLISAKLKLRGDISPDTERKVQQAANGILLNYQKTRKPLDHKSIVSATKISHLCRQYLNEESKLVQNSKAEANKLFESTLPKNLTEETEKEMKHDYEELNRMVLNRCFKIRQQMFINVRDDDVSRFGKMKLLMWSAEVFTLWSTWLSKKLLREIDIIQRKRAIQESDALVLREQIAAELKQGESSFKDELLQRLSSLQRNDAIGNDNMLTIFDEKLQNDLKLLEDSGTGQAIKSFKDEVAYITQRWQLYSDKVDEWREKHEQKQNKIFDNVLTVVRDLRVKHIKGIIEKVELGMIKHFSKSESNRDKEIAATTTEINQEVSDESEASSRGDGLKLILECIEDLQADFSGVENENVSLTENFLEEIQEACESIRKTASDIMDDFGCKIEDKISQSRFKFKSLLFALRDMSQHKAQMLLGDWTHCLQKALTEIYVHKDLQQYHELTTLRKDTEETEEAVIFWFKDIESITRSEFEKTSNSFKDYVEKCRDTCLKIYENDEDDFAEMTKSIIAKDVEEDFMNNSKMSCFAKEFLITQQFLVTLLHTLDQQQYLSDPEVKECFVKLKKVVQHLTNSEKGQEDQSKEVTKGDISHFLDQFQKYCSLQQVQKQSGVVSGIENMIFDDYGIADKIHKVVVAKKKQSELMDTMLKLQNENLRTLSHLVKMDKISHSDMMEFVKVLYMNLRKKRFDEIMNTIHGSNEQNYLAELVRYQLENEIPKTMPEEQEVQQEIEMKKKKKKKKNTALRKNTVAPDK